jgi:hypothetical protein
MRAEHRINGQVKVLRNSRNRTELFSAYKGWQALKQQFTRDKSGQIVAI